MTTRPGLTADATVLHALTFAAFITGSVGFVLGIGLLVAGAAVPALVLRLLPRPLVWVGLVIAAVSELSFLAMVVEPLQFLFPIGRFGGLTPTRSGGSPRPAPDASSPCRSTQLTTMRSRRPSNERPTPRAGCGSP